MGQVILEAEETPPGDVDFYTGMDTPLSIQVDCPDNSNPNSVGNFFECDLISPNPAPQELAFPSVSLNNPVHLQTPCRIPSNPPTFDQLASPLTPDNILFKMEIDPPEEASSKPSSTSLTFGSLANPSTSFVSNSLQVAAMVRQTMLRNKFTN
jgi:hypothetical protein